MSSFASRPGTRSCGKIYRWHRFGQNWELLPEKKIPAAKFLASLDLFIYPLGHRFVESWGRSTLEAMLTGGIPLVPHGHQFHNMMVHEESGFICKNFADFKYYAQQLYKNGFGRGSAARLPNMRARWCVIWSITVNSGLRR